MPSHRTSFPSFGGTTDLIISSRLLHTPMRRVLCKPGCLRSIRWPTIRHFSPGGALRVSQVPGESSRTFAMLKRPRPRRCAPPVVAFRCCPRWSDDEGRSYNVNFEADSHGFSTRCLRFQIRLSLHWQDSLPVGGEPLPDGI